MRNIPGTIPTWRPFHLEKTQKTAKQKSTPSIFQNLTYRKKKAQNGRRRFFFGHFLHFFQRESYFFAKTNNFRVNLRRRYGLEKIYADHFFCGSRKYIFLGSDARNVKSYKKIDEKAETGKFTVFTMCNQLRGAKNMDY